MRENIKKIVLIGLWIEVTFTLFGGESYVNNQGQLIVDGEPFFIMGFFADSYASSYEDKIASIDSLSRAGFNTVISSAIGADHETASHLEHAQESGMKVIYPGALNNQWKAYHLNKMETFKDAAGLLGWYIADDSHGMHPDTIKMYHEQAKGIDSTHITTHSMALSCWNDYGQDFIKERIKYCDVLQMQSYPIGKEAIDEVYHDMRLTLAAARTSKTPVVVDLQLFSWQLTGHSWGRWPTPKEADLMTWLAIVAGVDGYLYFTYYDKLVEPARALSQSQPRLWKAVKKTAAMVNLIKADLLKHRKFITFSPKSNLYYGQWITADHSTVIAVNTSGSDSLSISIPILEEHSNLELLFKSRPGDLSIQGQFLKGRIGPMSAQFYRLFPDETKIDSEVRPNSYDMKVYPNPSNNRLQLLVNAGNSEPLNIRLYSIQGRLIKSKSVEIEYSGKHRYTLPVNGLAAGIYIIRVKTGNRIITRKWTYLP
jgi:hypothetical protein